MTKTQEDNLQSLYAQLDQLNRQQQENKKQVDNLTNAIETLLIQKQETDKKYEDSILKFRELKTYINKKELEYGKNANLDTPIDIALKVRKLSIITSVSIWLFWTGIGFIIWLAYQILLFQELLNLLKNGVNYRRTTYITLNMLSFLILPAFVASPLLAIWIKKRIKLYRQNHPNE